MKSGRVSTVRRRWPYLGAAIVLAAVIAASCWIDDDDDPTPTPRSEFPLDTSPDAVDLAHAYAPVLYLAAQDPGCDDTFDTDPYDPTDVGVFLDKPDVRLVKNRPFPVPDRVLMSQPRESDIYGAGEDDYLDVLEDSHPRNEGDRCDFQTAYEDARGQQPPIVYARVVHDGDKTALQYWFFYYFNDWINRHEGDYESIQLLFGEASNSEILNRNLEPDSVAYSQHTAGRRFRWGDIQQEPRGSRHPVVYVGAGSHANYIDPGFWHAEIDKWFDGCDWTVDGSRSLYPARRLEAAPPSGATPSTPQQNEYRLQLFSRPARATDPFAWSNFAGNWGELSFFGFSGPTAPPQKDQWNDPWAWSSELSDDAFDECAQREGRRRPASAGARILGQDESFVEDVFVLAGDIVTFLITWGGSEVSLTLESPSGDMIGPNDASKFAVHEKRENYEVYRLENVEAGQWQLHIEGTDLPVPETVTWEVWDIAPPCNAVDRQSDRDADLDGIKNGDEAANNTNPCNWDTDGDGVSDGEEQRDAARATYFAELNKLAEGYGADVEQIEAERKLGLSDPDRDLLALDRKYFEERVARFDQLARDAALLDPPPDIEPEHGEFVRALTDLVPELRETLDAIFSAETTQEFDALLLRLSSGDRVQRVKDSCLTLQKIAEADGISLALAGALRCAPNDVPFRADRSPASAD